MLANQIPFVQDNSTSQPRGPTAPSRLCLAQGTQPQFGKVTRKWRFWPEETSLRKPEACPASFAGVLSETPFPTQNFGTR
jgi:hypothetical protein